MDSNCTSEETTIIEGVFGKLYRDADKGKWIVCDTKPYQDESVTSSFENKFSSEFDPLLIKSYTIVNTNQIEIMIITWGATIVSLKCPDKYGHSVDVVLGFDNLESYIDPEINPYIGCILGRCANRIKNGVFSIKNETYYLSKNDNTNHHLHGGTNGFGRQIWDSYIDGCSVVMSYLSENGEEGYPGSVLTTLRFKLTAYNKLEICMRATCSKPTVVNLSHGSFFNLAGHNAGEKELKNHKICINADRWTFADYTDPVPTGAIRGVGGTVMDLRVPKLLEEYMYRVPPGNGYDHNFCISRNANHGSTFVARISHAKTGRILEIYSDQPGVQLYTAGRFPESNEEFIKIINGQNLNNLNNNIHNNRGQEFIIGKTEARYGKYSAFSIQPQNYPNAINYSHFPCSILRPGQVYYHDLVYKFDVQSANFMV